MTRNQAGPGPKQVDRVVVANDFGHVNGGASAVAVVSALGLADAGLAVTYLCAVPPLDPRLSAHPGITVACTGQPDLLAEPNPLKAGSRGLWNPEAARALTRVLATADPARTVVHVHGFSKALTSSLPSRARKLGFQVVLTLHDYFIACPNGGLFDFPGRVPCRRRPLSLTCVLAGCDSRSRLHKAWRLLRQVVQNRVLGHSGRFHYILLSRLQQELLEPLLPNPGHVLRIPNPVDVPPGPAVAAAANRDILFVGSLTAHKGVLDLAQALARTGQPALFVGDGPLRGEVARSCPGARITGWVDPTAVRGYLRKARTVVFPSLWYEAQPLVPLEALAHGVPVIASDVSSARECVQDGRNGLLYRTGDADALQACLGRMGDDHLVERLARQAFADYWSRPFTPERHVRDLIQAYETILGGPPVRD